MANQQDQAHPQAERDRVIVNRLLKGESTDENLAELARLNIRYRNFPGARDIQKDLQFIFNKWNLTEDTLYAMTRQIHAEARVYHHLRVSDEDQDWS